MKTDITIWQDFTLSLNADAVLRGQGANPAIIRARQPRLVKAAEQAVIIGNQVMRPTAAMIELPVTAIKHERLILGQSGILSGSLILSQIGKADRVALIVCTIGEEIEDLIHSLEQSDMVLALALEGFANSAVDELSRLICSQIAELASQTGLNTSTPLSPGSSGWPLEKGQPEIFALLDTMTTIGVKLSENFMMLPRKSASFVIGIGHEMTSSDPCELCDLQEICRFRKLET